MLTGNWTWTSSEIVSIRMLNRQRNVRKFINKIDTINLDLLKLKSVFTGIFSYVIFLYFVECSLEDKTYEDGAEVRVDCNIWLVSLSLDQ